MEWVPERDKLQPAERMETSLTADQEEKLHTVFNLFDTNGSGQLDLDDFVDFLNAVDVDVQNAESDMVKHLFCSVDVNSKGRIVVLYNGIHTYTYL